MTAIVGALREWFGIEFFLLFLFMWHAIIIFMHMCVFFKRENSKWILCDHLKYTKRKNAKL